MAISFKKEVIAEAIKQVLAEAEVHVISKDKPEEDKKRIKAAMKSAGVTNPQAYADIDTLKANDTVTTEDHAEDPNDESDMAKVQLANVIHYAQELLTMIKDGQQLDAWVQSKLTIAFDYIDSVKHYLEGEDYLASTDAPVDAPVDEAMDINDPIMMKLRAAKMKTYKTEPQAAPKANTPKANTNDSKLAALKKYRAQVMRDMEQEAEPEGGPIADKYGAELNKIDKAIAKLSGHGEWGPEAENPYMSKAEIERRAAMMEDEPVEEPIAEMEDDADVSGLDAGFEDDTANAPKGDKKLNKQLSKNDKIIAAFNELKPLFKLAAAGDKDALETLKANQHVVLAYKKLKQI